MLITVPVIENQTMTDLTEQIVTETMMITTMIAVIIEVASEAGSEVAVAVGGTIATDTVTGVEIESGLLSREVDVAGLEVLLIDMVGGEA